MKKFVHTRWRKLSRPLPPVPDLVAWMFVNGVCGLAALQVSYAGGNTREYRSRERC